MKNVNQKRVRTLVHAPARVVALLASAWMLGAFLPSASASVKPGSLTCEYRTNPAGIDILNPRLSWELSSIENGERQTAYRILVASSERLLNTDQGDIWDTKKVVSDQSVNIYYRGTPLTTGQRCFWKVMAWGKDGSESAWSAPASWSMGLLEEKDWKARWIGLNKFVGSDDSAGLTRLAARFVRKEFTARQEVISATAYICGLGLYELYLNGRKVGDDVLAPAQTQFDKKVFYNTFDVTEYLHPGRNAIGVVLGNGRYFTIRSWVRNFGFPNLLMQIAITYRDGSRAVLGTDGTWKITADGPITENNEWDGEKYDARKELNGWAEAGFDDRSWREAELLARPAEQIRAQMNEPMRVTKIIKPLSVEEARPGAFIYDMGQNLTGWVRLQVRGERGVRIQLRFAESLHEDTLFTANLRSAKATDEYICKGEGVEAWEPRFVYHGFRFVEVTGYPGKPGLEAIEGRVVHDDLARIGNFSSSNEVMNTTFRNAVWGIRDNYKSFPTDCPQRDERHGWLGDRAMGSMGESFVFNIDNLYAKWIRDMMDSQADSGAMPDVAPAHVQVFADNATWAGTPIILLEMLRRQYGDLEIVRQAYPSMKKWYDYMARKYLRNGLMPRDTYGDWCVPPDEPDAIHTADPAKNTLGSYIGSAYFIYLTNLMRRFADLLERKEEAEHFAREAGLMKEAFNRAYYDPRTGAYSNNTATASVLALAFGLVEEKERPRVADNLVRAIETTAQGHIPTGLIGGQFLMRTLTAIGRADMAVRFATQTDYPSWGYMARHGATTIWELWNSNTADPGMNSQNHVMLLGDLLTWYFENLAGIRSSTENPGFKHIMMAPTLIAGLDSVSASYRSPYGLIVSRWRVEGGRFTWDVSVPVNATATVHIPAGRPDDVLAGGQPIARSFAAGSLKMKNGALVVDVPSGHYRFSSTGFSSVSPPAMVAPPRIRNNDLSSAAPISITMTCETQGALIRYTTDGTEPTEASPVYDGRLEITRSSRLRTKAFKNGFMSSYECTADVEIHRQRIPVRQITLMTRYTTDYAVARGDSALIDFEEGTMSYIDRKWVGYRKNDMEVILDLGKPTTIHGISMRFISSPKLWIFLPEAIEIGTSHTMDNFVPAAGAQYGAPREVYTVQRYSFPLPEVEARYVKVRAKNIGALPSWHSNAGSDAYMFVDEVFVE